MQDEEEIKEFLSRKTPEEKIAESLDKIVQLMDYQNKILTEIDKTLRKRR